MIENLVLVYFIMYTIKQNNIIKLNYDIYIYIYTCIISKDKIIKVYY